MKRKWFEEKAETFDPETQKASGPGYDEGYKRVFRDLIRPQNLIPIPTSQRRVIDDLGRHPDVKAQNAYRAGWDNIFGGDNASA